VHLEIITPEKKVYTGEVKLIQVPGTKGSFEILKNHAPIISTLEKGVVKVVESNDSIEYFNIKSGVIEVKKNNVLILAESAE
jgi:F-type H+-transporting ATPase subunit epsilon